jgi:hypothetical protein
MATVAEHVSIGALWRASAADTALKWAVRSCFAVIALGQLLFVIHIVSFYGRATLAGDFARWNKALPSPGYTPGDRVGNAAVGIHLMVAAIITSLGLLQLAPRIRNRFPVFHRWSGRVYVAMAFLASGSALYLQMVRHSGVANAIEHIGIEINAVLIMLCAGLALRYALARQFDTHRRWALRLFMVVSGVWFFRAGLFFWIAINHGPVGFDPDTFRGPALTALSFLQYILPLTVLELYLRTRDRAGQARRLAMAAILLVLTVAMGIGIFGVTGFLVASGVAV